MARVAGGEERRRVLQVLVAERDDLGRLIGRRLAEMSPKTLTGAELQLDDGPARDSELFLVDGNNLAYRAFFALPEELATSEGFSTNALLGFTNMLFKLLADYRPKGVAVAWDTRPVHRGPSCRDATRSSASRCRTCCASSSRTSGRSWRRSATATSSSRAGRPTT